MIDKTTRMVSENLARAINRRGFLRQASGVVFTGLAAVASGHLAPLTASAASPRPGPPIPTLPVCNPPGPYCNLDGNWQDPNGCHGSSCYQHLVNGQVVQCRLWYDLYQSGCWTTAVSGGYWVCCDCECGTPRIGTCGCAKFSTSITPRPDGVTGPPGV